MDFSIVFVILNLIILESLLSVDNAAVLAVMVNKNLDNPVDRKRALTYGIIGAYVFRGICLLAAAWLVKIMWLKVVGGLYLIYLAYEHFTPEKDSIEEGMDETSVGVAGWFYRHVSNLKNSIGIFWVTVILVEIMDLAFSLDNIFAAVALTDVVWAIVLGVFIGILAMRFVAQRFVELMQKYPSLENTAFFVIALLGIKLAASGIASWFFPGSAVTALFDHHYTDMGFSVITLLVFLYPIIKGK